MEKFIYHCVIVTLLKGAKKKKLPLPTRKKKLRKNVNDSKSRNGYLSEPTQWN